MTAAEVLLEIAGSTEPVTVLADNVERPLKTAELRRLGGAIAEARARMRTEAENQTRAEALGLAPKLPGGPPPE